MAMDITKSTLPELLQHISELTASKKVDALREIGNLKPALQEALMLTYHNAIQFDLPPGVPPYKGTDMPENWGYNRLPKELRKFKYFVKGFNISPIKRESIFIELLESVSAEEAKLVIMIKDKKLTYKGITKKVVMEAMPQIFHGEVAE